MTVTPPTPSSDMVPVYLKVNNFDGTPVNAKVRFTPNFDRMDDAVDDLIVVAKPLLGTITNGVMNFALPATDDPDFSLTGWTYKVEELFVPGGRTYEINVPISQKDVGINLRTVTAVGQVTETQASTIFASLNTVSGQVDSIMRYGVFSPPTGEAIVIPG